MTIKLFAFLLLRLAFPVVSDMLPNPTPYNVTISDGTIQGPIYFKGTVWYHWEEDLEGFTVVPTQNGYYYAKRNNNSGILEATGLAIRKMNNGALIGSHPKTIGLEQHEQDSDEVKIKRCGDFCPGNSGNNGNKRSLRKSRTLVSTKGILKNLVVIFRFSDHAARTMPSQSDLNILMNHPGDGVNTAFHALAPTGSVREHYLKSSYNQLTIDSTVAVWVTLDYTESQCAASQSGLTSTIHTCLINALNKVDAQINFNDFDTDGNRVIDAIAFLHSGYAAEWGGNDAYQAYYTNRIWSHKWQLSTTWTSAEGVKVSAYHISPAIWGTSGSSIGRIGVIAHETGHYLGITDLYDSDSSPGEGIGSWGLMANSWGFDGTQFYPPPMDAWCKIYLGWVSPVVILPNSVPYTIGPQCVDPTIYKITRNFPNGEYLLIENRHKSCRYDSRMGGTYDGGLAIWHIDENQGSWSLEGYPGQTGWPGNNNHYKVAILQADKLYELEKGVNRGNAGDLFHAGDNLGPSSTSSGPYPNSDAYAFGTVTKTFNCIGSIALNSTSNYYSFTLFHCAPTMSPTAKTTKNPTKKPTGRPSKIPTKRPSKNPTRKPTKIPTNSPTRRPTRKPSTTLSKLPTDVPSNRPSAAKSASRTPSLRLTSPTTKPTSNPTRDPTRKMSVNPTVIATNNPTRIPTRKPTGKPTKNPTMKPVKTSTVNPTRKPTKNPTAKPTRKPTRRPTKKPTKNPTRRPTKKPTRMPTRRPTKKPTRKPTRRPTRKPTRKPTRRPTRKPTRKPTRRPTGRLPTKKPNPSVNK